MRLPLRRRNLFLSLIVAWDFSCVGFFMIAKHATIVIDLYERSSPTAGREAGSEERARGGGRQTGEPVSPKNPLLLGPRPGLCLAAASAVLRVCHSRWWPSALERPQEVSRRAPQRRSAADGRVAPFAALCGAPVCGEGVAPGLQSSRDGRRGWVKRMVDGHQSQLSDGHSSLFAKQ